MKELEKRINKIYKGQLEFLCEEYDFLEKLCKELPQPNDVAKIVYTPKVVLLLQSIQEILVRTEIIIDKDIRVFNENWEDGVESIDKQKEFNLKKTSPDQFFIFQPVGEHDRLSPEEEADFQEVFTKVIEAPDSFVQNVEGKIREELVTYQTVLSNLFDVDTTAVSQTNIGGLKQPAAKQYQEETIQKHLSSIRKFVTTEQDFDFLAVSLSYYFDKGEFIKPEKPIIVKGGTNKKVFGWAINLIFKDLGIKRIPAMLLEFASKHISLYLNDSFDPIKYTESNLYNYFKSNPKNF